jgi:hypothetical protein
MSQVRTNGKAPERYRGRHPVWKGPYKGMNLLKYFTRMVIRRPGAKPYEQVIFYMSEEDKAKYPMLLDVETPRLRSGKPATPRMAIKEELLFNGELICAICSMEYDHTLPHATAFTIDSTSDAEPSSSAPNSYKYLKKKLERGAAQILCRSCEYNKTFRSPAHAQGNCRKRNHPL